MTALTGGASDDPLAASATPRSEQYLELIGTHLRASLAEAYCLVLIDEVTTEVPIGAEVPVSFLAQRA